MLSFNHPNVMPLLGLCLDEGTPLLIMPFMVKGSLLEYVKQNREILCFIEKAEIDKVKELAFILKQICL